MSPLSKLSCLLIISAGAIHGSSDSWAPQAPVVYVDFSMVDADMSDEDAFEMGGGAASESTVGGVAGMCCGLQEQTEPIFSQEFKSNLDTSFWNVRTGGGGWGNSELQEYTASAITTGSGDVTLTTSRAGDKFYSGRIDTQDKVLVQYGTVCARMKIPSVESGLWPAFWMLGANFAQTAYQYQSGQIDIMEMGQGPSSSGEPDSLADSRVVSGAIWEATDMGMLKTMSSSRAKDFAYDVAGSGYYSIYTLDWSPTSLTTYVNATQVWTMDIGDCMNDGCEELHQAHFLLMSLAVGGEFSGITSADGVLAPLPASMDIDWIRVYNLRGDLQLSGTAFGAVTPGTSAPVASPVDTSVVAQAPVVSPLTTTPAAMPDESPQCEEENFNVCANTRPTSFTVIKTVGDVCSSKCVKDAELLAAWDEGYTCGLCPVDDSPSCPDEVCANTTPTRFTVRRIDTLTGECETQCAGGDSLSAAFANQFVCGACPDPPPTPEPSASPSGAPSESPSAKPSFTLSAMPTLSPVAKPTASPSSKPTSASTTKLTLSPSAKPTPTPTAKPTASPSAKPTPTPTAKPTASPSSKPTTAPTAKPTASPSSKPTTAPTAKPTVIPSAMPNASLVVEQEGAEASCPVGMPTCGNENDLQTKYVVRKNSMATNVCETQCVSGVDLTVALNTGFVCGACPDPLTSEPSVSPVANPMCPNAASMVTCGTGGFVVSKTDTVIGCEMQCAEGAAALSNAFANNWVCGACPAPTMPECPNAASMVPCGGNGGVSVFGGTDNGCVTQCVEGAVALSNAFTRGWVCGVCPGTTLPEEDSPCPDAASMVPCGTDGDGVSVFGNPGNGCETQCVVGSAALSTAFARGWVCGVCPGTTPINEDPLPVTCPEQMTPCSAGSPPGYIVSITNTTSGACAEICAAGEALASLLGNGYVCSACPGVVPDAVVPGAVTTFAPTPLLRAAGTIAPTPSPVEIAPVSPNVAAPVPTSPNTGITPNTGVTQNAGGGDSCSKSKSKGNGGSCSKSKGGSGTSNSRASITDTLDADSASPNVARNGVLVATAAMAALLALVHLF